MLQALPEYIPIEPGYAAHLKTQKLINDVLGNVCRETLDGWVVFSEDITSTQGVNFVDMKLVVMDFEHYGDYDILPIPADIAADIIKDVLAVLMPTPPPDKRVDPIAEQPVNKR